MEPFEDWLGVNKSKKFKETEIDSKVGKVSNVRKTKDGVSRWQFRVNVDKNIAAQIGLAENMQALHDDLQMIKLRIEEGLSGRDSIVSLLVQEDRAKVVRNSRKERRPAKVSSPTPGRTKPTQTC